ncbi:CAP domain-containing protein [Streptomyces coeruleoprunus]|uniref:CAP domain-containing protein n=1 Tax=Streptomyces coeruleoprunus TaxID=285563 RepID=A0ABV9XI43_9ACTN
MQHHPFDEPGQDQQQDGRPRGRHRTGRRAAAAPAGAPRRHAKRRWTYQGIGTVVAGAVAVAAVATGTLVLGGTDSGILATGTDAPTHPGGHDRTRNGGGSGNGSGTPTPEAGRPTQGTLLKEPSPNASASSSGAAPSGTSTATPTAGATATGSAPATASPTARRATTGAAAPTKRPVPPKTRPTPQPGAAGGAAGEYVRSVVALANAERAKAGCSPLRVNSSLQAAAQRHADDMAARNYYEHDSPEGRNAGDRMQAAGYRWRTWGENIHRGPKAPAAAMRDWMSSPGHRENILNCKFKDIGVGVNLRANGPWWVQNFGTAG